MVAGMEIKEFEKVLKTGEGATIEFKRCGGNPERDTFKAVFDGPLDLTSFVACRSFFN